MASTRAGRGTTTVAFDRLQYGDLVAFYVEEQVRRHTDALITPSPTARVLVMHTYMTRAV